MNCNIDGESWSEEHLHWFSNIRWLKVQKLLSAVQAVMGIKAYKPTLATQATEVTTEQHRTLFGQREKKTLVQDTRPNAN